MSKRNLTALRSQFRGQLGVVSVLICLVASPAFAATATGTLAEVSVKYETTGSYFPQLHAKIGSVDYWAQPNVAPDPSCSALTASVDAIKIWQAMLTSALLSGRTVTITYTVCAAVGFNYITDVKL